MTSLAFSVALLVVSVQVSVPASPGPLGERLHVANETLGGTARCIDDDHARIIRGRLETTRHVNTRGSHTAGAEFEFFVADADFVGSGDDEK